MIFFTFLPSALVVMMVVSVVIGAREVEEGVGVVRAVSVSVSVAAGAVCAGGDCTYAMVCGGVEVLRCECALEDLDMRLRAAHFPSASRFPIAGI